MPNWQCQTQIPQDEVKKMQWYFYHPVTSHTKCCIHFVAVNQLQVELRHTEMAMHYHYSVSKTNTFYNLKLWFSNKCDNTQSNCLNKPVLLSLCDKYIPRIISWIK